MSTVRRKLQLESKLFENVDKNTVVWMSHTDYIDKIPEGFKITAYSNDCPCAAYENEEKKLYAVQYHPEVNHSVQGQQMLKNFLFNVCGCKGDWLMSDFAENQFMLCVKRLVTVKFCVLFQAVWIHLLRQLCFIKR